jgi:hypothetical protein
MALHLQRSGIENIKPPSWNVFQALPLADKHPGLRLWRGNACNVVFDSWIISENMRLSMFVPQMFVLCASKLKPLVSFPPVFHYFEGHTLRTSSRKWCSKCKGGSSRIGTLVTLVTFLQNLNLAFSKWLSKCMSVTIKDFRHLNSVWPFKEMIP